MMQGIVDDLMARGEWIRVCGAVVVSLAQGLMSSSPTLATFPSGFSICLPPVHPAVIGYLAFAGVQIQGLFS